MARTEPEAAVSALLALMARLREPQRGCPWDLAQDFRSIAPYTIEEAYEVRDAIERADAGKLCEELGDLLFQVVFHARMAEERGWFDFAAVAAGIHAKLVRRHPHVFNAAERSADAHSLPAEVLAGATPAATLDVSGQGAQWEQIKAHERAVGGGADASALADIAQGMPALMRAAKLGRRAARVGFDWPQGEAVRRKVDEELGELDAALAAADGATDAHVVEEFGDVLFTLVNWSRHLALDAEESLRRASEKFERRFRRMEQLAGERGLALTALDAEQWEALWAEAKGRP